MRNISTLLAWRYLRGTTHEKSIATMTKVSFISIFIATAALALVMAVMNGFEQATHEKIQGIHAQLIMRNYGMPLPLKELNERLAAEFPHVTAWSPSTTRQVIVKNPNDDESTMVMIKGVDPQKEETVSAIGSKIVDSIEPDKKLSALLKKEPLLIGTKLAESLRVTPGNALEIIYSPEDERSSKSISFASEEAGVGGTFSTGIEEFDSSLLLTPLSFLQQLFPSAEATELALSLKPGSNEADIIQELRDTFNLEVFSWKELYPALVAALTLEKYAMFFILALIVLVASMNILSLLFMQITQKRGDIAILKAMGATDSMIRKLFIRFGMLISFMATVAGLIFALFISWLLETYPFITLPDAYYVTHLPARMEPSIILLVFITSMLISFIATWYPAHRTKKINVANLLRFEA